MDPRFDRPVDHGFSRSYFASVLAFLAVLAGAACSVPSAPGYRILKQTRDVSFVPGETPELHVASFYVLENSGTMDLPSMDVTLPDEKAYGRKDLRVEMDGRALNPVNLPEENQWSSPNVRRIMFDTLWKRQEKSALKIEYAFRLPADPGSRITVGPDNFHLSSRGWAPVLQPPKHFLAPRPTRPARASFTVRVPSDFLVLARGTPSGRKQDGHETEYRFELVKDDLTPFVVAGKYVASSPERDAASAIFWTFQPLKDRSELPLRRIRAAWNFLEKDFGPLDKNIRAPHAVEFRNSQGVLTVEPGIEPEPFPGGALLDSDAMELGISDERLFRAVTHGLAHNWFGDEVFFAPYAAIGMGEGLPEYATIAVEESENGEAGRRRRIAEYLNEYDKLRSEAEETPLGVTMTADPIEQRRIALAKAPLFFVALEDACGEQAMRSGLREMVTLLRGQQTGYDALRSALEQSSGKNLAGVFRVWLNDKDIPAEFRTRYAEPPHEPRP